MSIAFNKFVIPLAGAAVLGTAAFGTSAVAAASAPTSHKPKLNLTQREARYKTHLDNLVKRGKLTTTQEQAVLSEHQQLVDELKSAKSSSKSEKQQVRKTVRQQAKTWAEDNHVPDRFVLPHHSHHRWTVKPQHS